MGRVHDEPVTDGCNIPFYLVGVSDLHTRGGSFLGLGRDEPVRVGGSHVLRAAPRRERDRAREESGLMPGSSARTNVSSST